MSSNFGMDLSQLLTRQEAERLLNSYINSRSVWKGKKPVVDETLWQKIFEMMSLFLLSNCFMLLSLSITCSDDEESKLLHEWAKGKIEFLNDIELMKSSQVEGTLL